MQRDCTYQNLPCRGTVHIRAFHTEGLYISEPSMQRDCTYQSLPCRGTVHIRAFHGSLARSADQLHSKSHDQSHDQSHGLLTMPYLECLNAVMSFQCHQLPSNSLHPRHLTWLYVLKLWGRGGGVGRKGGGNITHMQPSTSALTPSTVRPLNKDRSNVMFETDTSDMCSDGGVTWGGGG